MKYTFTFSEISHGRVEIEADHPPDKSEVIDHILEGKAHYHSTGYSDIKLTDGRQRTERERPYER